MYEIVVLGQIPGTHVTINFSAWLMCVSLAAGFIAVRKAARSKRLESVAISSALFLTVRARRLSEQAFEA